MTRLMIDLWASVVTVFAVAFILIAYGIARFFQFILAVALLVLCISVLTGCATAYTPEQAAFACESKLKEFERREPNKLIKVKCK